MRVQNGLEGSEAAFSHNVENGIVSVKEPLRAL